LQLAEGFEIAMATTSMQIKGKIQAFNGTRVPFTILSGAAS